VVVFGDLCFLKTGILDCTAVKSSKLAQGIPYHCS